MLLLPPHMIPRPDEVISPGPPSQARALDHRFSDGITVRLLWRKWDARLWVTVDDVKDGQRYSIEVRDQAKAFDVFHHPFAYVPDAGVGAELPAR